MEDLCEYTVGTIDFHAEAPDSNLSRDTSYPKRAFSWLFLNSETFKFIGCLKTACYILVVFDIDSVVK